MVERLEQKTAVTAAALPDRLMRIAASPSPRSSAGARRPAPRRRWRRRRRPTASDTCPLVLLAQGDALVASAPARSRRSARGSGAAAAAAAARARTSPPAYFRARGVLEAQSADAAGDVLRARRRGAARRAAARDRGVRCRGRRTPRSTSTRARCAFRSRSRARSTTRTCACPNARAVRGHAGARLSRRRRRRRRLRGARLRGGGDVVQPRRSTATCSTAARWWRCGSPPSRSARWGRRPGGARSTIPGPTGSGSATASRSCTARCSSRETIGAGMDLPAAVAALASRPAEYIFLHAPSGNQQGAVLEPGVTLCARRLDVVARGEWQRAAGGNGWGAGAALTLLRARSARAPAGRLRAPHRPATRFGAGQLRAAPADARDRLTRGQLTRFDRTRMLA